MIQNSITRRNLAKGAAWSVPVVAAMGAAPAYAASALICSPTAECKDPGEGYNTKDYVVRTNCVSGQPVECVQVYDDKARRWVTATRRPDGSWLARGFNDSRRDRVVKIIATDGAEFVRMIPFPPC